MSPAANHIKRKSFRRKQMENLINQGYFRRPVEKRRFSTRRIMQGNIRRIEDRKTLELLHKFIKLKIEEKTQSRQRMKNYEESLAKIKGKLVSASTRTTKRTKKKQMDLGIHPDSNIKPRDYNQALGEYIKFASQQGEKLDRKRVKIGTKAEAAKETISKARSARKISREKGRLESVIINLAGIPVEFKVNKMNLEIIEEKLRPKTRLDSNEAFTRKILMKNPRRRIITIIKNAEKNGRTVDRAFVEGVIRQMIKEGLIER